MTDRRSTTGALLALLAATFFGVGGAVAGGVFDVLEPATVAQARSAIAAILLAGWAAYRGVLWPIDRIWRFAILGVILALINLTFYMAIDRLGVGPGATVQFLGPIFILVWIATVRREHVGAVAWAAALAAILGVGMVTSAWSGGATDVVGIAAGLAAAILFACYLLYGEVLGRDHPPAAIGAWGFVFASVIWAIVLPWWSFPFEAARGVIVDLVVIGVIGTAAGFVVEFAALRLASPGIIGIVATAEPAIGAIAAVVLLDQRLDPVQWAGIVVVMISVAVVQRWGLSDAPIATPVT